MGHPLHAFDDDKLSGHEIQVRSAKEGERFITLDGKERVLKANNLLICDAEKPVALAGIMGGQNSEITDGTVNILLESAYFNPICIRKTCKQLLVQTDSSVRFVRGTDPNNLIPVLDRAAMLIQQVAGGQVATGVIDIKAGDFSLKRSIAASAGSATCWGPISALAKWKISFKRLGFKYTSDGQDVFTVEPPTFRVDLTSEVDLIEEVARIYGYDNFPKPTPRYTSAPQPHAPIYLFEKEMRSTLVAEGLQEFITCDLIGPTLDHIVQDKSIDPESLVKVLNPTSIEQPILRTSLLPGMLQVVKYNFDHQNPNIHGFEIGRVHLNRTTNIKSNRLQGLSWQEKKPLIIGTESLIHLIFTI